MHSCDPYQKFDNKNQNLGKRKRGTEEEDAIPGDRMPLLESSQVPTELLGETVWLSQTGNQSSE